MISVERGWRVPVAHRAPVRAVAGADGLILTSGGDGMIRSWDAVSGAPGGFAVAGPDRATFLAVAGSLVVCSDGTTVRRFDRGTGAEVGERLRAPSSFLPSGGLGVMAVAGPLLVAETTGSLTRWDIATGEPVGPWWTGSLGRLLALAAWRRADGRTVVATSENDGTLRLWDAVSGEPLGKPLGGHERPVVALLHLPEEDVLVGQEFHGPIRRWDATGGEPLEALPQTSHGMNEGGLAASPDGRLLFSVDQSATLWRWDLASWQAEALLVGRSRVTAPAVVPSASGPLCVVGDEQGSVRRWDLAGRPVGGDVAGHPAKVQKLIAVPGLFVSAGQDGARCWDAATGEPAGDPSALAPTCYGLAAARLPDGRLMAATGTHEGILRFEPLTGDLEPLDPDDETLVWTVANGTWPDGRPFFAGGTDDGLVQVVDAETGEPLRRPLKVSKAQVLAVALTTLEDGTVLLASGGEDRRILRWNAVTGEQIGDALEVGEYWVMGLSFESGVLVSVDDDGEVRRWHAVTGEPAGAEPSPRGVTAILADGRTVRAIGGEDGSLTATMS
ncbi:WD40 repeat domain-containing protein [Actinoplanes sp. Pm04-4]|uniref:WD40 repeat domain-containing protein n=1 Tax=Paractinoplanes pyxinae TaxID=2997416 RepID=A0ABT4BE20_9ACTN|nr:WD40 repeat domain-containing protein [Actinoplanes pyxinae]MCY1144237.1 WD40 repeat domain-containing protein [Actinoplanes pyxinae]